MIDATNINKRKSFDEKLYRKNLVNYLFIVGWLAGLAGLASILYICACKCMQMFTHGVKKVVSPKAKKKWDIFTNCEHLFCVFILIFPLLKTCMHRYTFSPPTLNVRVTDCLGVEKKKLLLFFVTKLF